MHQLLAHPRTSPPHPPQSGVVRPPPGSPRPGSFVVLAGEHMGRVFEATPGQEKVVAEARRKMGRGVMDAHVFAMMRLRQSHLLSALLAMSDRYMMDVLGKEGEGECGVVMVPAAGYECAHVKSGRGICMADVLGKDGGLLFSKRHAELGMSGAGGVPWLRRVSMR